MSETQQVKQKPIATVQPNYIQGKSGVNPNAKSDKDIQVFGGTNNKPPVQTTDKNPAQKPATKPIIKPVDKKPQLEKSISWREAFSLMGQGFVNKAKDLWKTVKEHPVQALAAAGVVTGAILAAPLIGISSAVAASGLAIVFAGVAVYHAAKHGLEALDHANKGQNNQLRQAFKNIGGDGFDLALTLPFVPKGVGTIIRAFKYAPKIGLNMELINGLRQAKGISGFLREFTKADLRINYHQMTKEIGLKVAPKLIFDDNMSLGIAGGFDPLSGEIRMNSRHLGFGTRCLMNVGYAAQKVMTFILRRFLGIKSPRNIPPNAEGFLRHELVHFQQFSDIARTEGIGPEEIQKASSSIMGLRNMQLPINNELYEQVIAEQGTIKAGTEQAELSQEYLNGFKANQTITQKLQELYYRVLQGDKTALKEYHSILREHENNIFEKPAFDAQEKYIDRVIKGRPGKLLVSAQALSRANSNN